MDAFNQLRITNYELRITEILCVFCIFFASMLSAQAQSTNQSFPTAITSSEISGQIPARDVGDARLTSYFYTFNGTQGDVFINVVTSNLNGDIDIFTADNLRPLTKMTLYADTVDGETGRVVYLRQPTKLILRVEGRTPNDNPATFRIKFAGSFAPALATENADAEMPQVKSNNQTDIRVNSVGTIIEVKPKPTPKPKEVIAEVPPAKEIKEPTAEVKTENQPEITQTVAEELPKKETTESVPTDQTVETKAEVKPTAPEKKTTPRRKILRKTTVAETPPTESPKPKVVKPLPASALENIRLIVLFKDGTKIERPMSEVLKFGVDRGVLTVIAKDGQIGRYSILDVEKVTIE